MKTFQLVPQVQLKGSCFFYPAGVGAGFVAGAGVGVGGIVPPPPLILFGG